MHELSICTAVAAIVRDHADGWPVSRVHLDVGHLRQVVPDTLAFNWEIVVSNTPLEGSILEINHIPVAIDCRRCGSTTTLDDPFFHCGTCGSTDIEITSGEELLVTSLDLAGAH